jgi:hypothetical protein
VVPMPTLLAIIDQNGSQQAHTHSGSAVEDHEHVAAS